MWKRQKKILWALVSNVQFQKIATQQTERCTIAVCGNLETPFRCNVLYMRFLTPESQRCCSIMEGASMWYELMDLSSVSWFVFLMFTLHWSLSLCLSLSLSLSLSFSGFLSLSGSLCFVNVCERIHVSAGCTKLSNYDDRTCDAGWGMIEYDDNKIWS